MNRSLFICLFLFTALGAGCMPQQNAAPPASALFPHVTPNTQVAPQPALPPIADPTAHVGLLPGAATSTAKFSVGQRVYAAWKNGATWYPGKITAMSGKLYTIAYDDGISEKSVTELRMIPAANGPVVDTFKNGESVIARTADGTWQKGEVREDKGATISIYFSDKTQDSVARDFVIPFTAHEGPTYIPLISSDKKMGEQFSVGTKVLANWHNGPRWWDATVTGKAGSNYIITYTDDHSKDTLPVTALAHYPKGAREVAPGEKIIVRSENGYWYNATVDSMTGSIINITFFDGFKQTISANDFAKAGS